MEIDAQEFVFEMLFYMSVMLLASFPLVVLIVYTCKNTVFYEM